MSHWSLSPIDFHGNPHSILIYISGLIGGWDSFYKAGLAPVINLTKEYTDSLVGDGSMTNPYRESGIAP